MMDNLMDLNESRLTKMNRSSANVTKTQPQDINNYRPVPLIFELTIN